MKRIDWVTSIFLITTPFFAIALGVYHGVFYELKPWMFVLLAAYWLITELGITAGYHRLFSHKSFEAKPWVQAVALFFGAGAYQGSAMKWCTEHRRHHREVDTDNDPYSIKKGFFFAHITWLFYEPEIKYEGKYEPDLKRNKLVAFQHKWYLLISTFSCFAVPTLIGFLLGDAFGGFVWGGLVRLVGVHHCTFFINSLAHMWGRQTYTDTVSARDNCVLAVLTCGEGYHNFHHMFEYDYRNGVRWFQWDPTKWAILMLKVAGQVDNLKTVSKEVIFKHKMNMDQKRLHLSTTQRETLESLRLRVIRSQEKFYELKNEYKQLKKSLSENSKDKLMAFKTDLKMAKLEMNYSIKQWSNMVHLLESAQAVPG